MAWLAQVSGGGWAVDKLVGGLEKHPHSDKSGEGVK